MLEIIIMIGVISWFARTAKSKGKSGPLWGIIGGISYYGPVLFFGYVIYPAMIKGSITYSNQTSYMILGIVLNLIVGIGCCLIARSILMSAEPDPSMINTTSSADAENKCPFCSETNSAGSQFCRACGKPLSI